MYENKSKKFKKKRKTHKERVEQLSVSMCNPGVKIVKFKTSDYLG